MCLFVCSSVVLKTDVVKNFVSSKTNAKLDYQTLKIKTYLVPNLSIYAKNVELLSKETDETFAQTQNLSLKIKLLPMISKKLDFKKISTQKMLINIEKDEEGIYNFTKLFPKNNKTSFKLTLKENTFNINNIVVNYNDKKLEKQLSLNSKAIEFDVDKKSKTLSLSTKGNIFQNNTNSDFDINIKTKYPFEKNNYADNIIKGDLMAYGIDLEIIKPFIKTYVDKKLSELSGFIEFIQISTSQQDEDKTRIIYNSTFDDFVFEREGWKNKIIAKGANKVDTNVTLSKDEIKINSFGFTAKDVDLKADGTVKLNKPVELDINAELKKSKVENILPLLPPNLPPEFRTTEKAKMYEVYGDVEGKANIKGKVPRPDIVGYIKGRNVHILDKKFHHTHKGTVDLEFKKRTMHMDILVDLENNQKATVKGFTYMFREGANEVKVKTTDKVDFPTAQKIILPISKVFNMQLGPIPEMNITKGKGLIDLFVMGSIDFIKLDGYCKFEDAQLTYNGLYGEITDGKGVVNFKDDVISVKSEKAFVKGNPLAVEGKVKINDYLDFNISTPLAKAEDILEIVNNSALLKDVKQGLSILTKASGDVRLFVNMNSKIVPVPYGKPPLPPEEAFKDMKVKGSAYLFSDKCNIEGFDTPIEKVRGIVDFTETIVNLNGIEAIVGTSPVKLDGVIYTDAETKIPDVNITVTSKAVNLKDTIRFLTQSYMYPKEYPDLSALYNISSKHDLDFKYHAKAIDFVTDKAYAVMNFINDKTDDPIKAQSGKVVMENSTVKVENVNVNLFDSNLSVTGNVKNVDTINPIYYLKIKSDKFNLENLNDVSKVKIMPKELKNVITQFQNYRGFADINISILNNVLDGQIKFVAPYCEHIQTKIPFIFNNFDVFLQKDKAYINNMTATIGGMPFFGDFSIYDVINVPKFDGYFTSKLKNDFIKNYLQNAFTKNLEISGDINLSAKFSGSVDNMNLQPKLTLNQDANVIFEATNFGEARDKREFVGDININKNKINIKKFDYIKYIASQNNRVNPINFATLSGNLIIDKNTIIPEKITFKTNKSLSARILNVFFKNQVFSQGNMNGDFEYSTDLTTMAGKLIGNIDCQSLDIPLFDTTIRNIKVLGDKDKIDINLFGFLSESRLRINSELANEITKNPKIKSLNILVDKMDINSLLDNISKTHKAMNTSNNIKNVDLSGLSIHNGGLEVKELVVKSLTAKDFTSSFFVDKNGIFNANDMRVKVGEGEINGKITYDLANTDINGDFKLNNVDANYVAETLFDSKNQIYGNANGQIYLSTKGLTADEKMKNLSGFVFFDVNDGRMPKLGSIEYLLRAGNIVKSGITGFSLNSVLELLNLVKTGYFSTISGGCKIENGMARDIEIFSQGENMSLYIHGNYDIEKTFADFEILGNLSKRISTVFGAVGNASLNTFFNLIPGISLGLSEKKLTENIEKIPSFSNGTYESRTFQAIINGNINDTSSVQSFKWVE